MNPTYITTVLCVGGVLSLLSKKTLRLSSLFDICLWIFYLIISPSVLEETNKFWDLSIGTVWHYDLWYPLRKWPLELQAILVILLIDFFGYWLHRLFHTNLFWPIHRLHHIPSQLDWFIAFRFHPIDSILSLIFYSLLFSFLSIPTAAITPYLVVNMVYNLFVHSELNIPFLRNQIIFNEPYFHSIHHTNEGMQKNFSGCVFKIWDYLFKTNTNNKIKEKSETVQDSNQLFSALFLSCTFEKVSNILIFSIIFFQYSHIFKENDMFPFTRVIYYTDAGTRPKIHLRLVTKTGILSAFDLLPRDRLVWLFEQMQYNIRIKNNQVAIEDSSRHTRAVNDIINNIPKKFRIPGNSINICAQLNWQTSLKCFYEIKF